jgi:hypothetical protein
VLPPVQKLTEVKGFSSDRPKDEESFDEWLASLTTLVAQPIERKSTKGHCRKRSHSERSLLDLPKKTDSKAIPAAATSPSSVSSLPMAILNADIPQDIFGQISRPTHGNFSILSLTNVLVEREQADSLRSETFMQFLSNFVQKPNSPKVSSCIEKTNVPQSFVNWNTVSRFIDSLGEHQLEKSDLSRAPPTELFHRFIEIFAVFKACSFLVRSISAVLEVENKPLFGGQPTNSFRRYKLP